MLTHYNIASNIEQMGQTFMFDRHDCLLGVLPFFHSFGFTVTLWLPAVLGVGVVYHPSPLDLTAVSELVRDYRVTFLLATPTFLQAYMRRCSPEDFGSLRYRGGRRRKIAGAARARVRRPIRHSPARRLRRHGMLAGRRREHARFSRAGFSPGRRRNAARIGHPLPGVSVRIVDPDTREPVRRRRARIAARARAQRDARAISASPKKRRKSCATAGTSPATSPPRTKTASSRSPTA